MTAADWQALGYSASFLVLALAIVYVGKLARDAIALLRGHKMGEILTTKDNPAAAIEVSGYLLGLVFGLVGSFQVTSDGWVAQASELAMTGLLVTAMLLLNDWLTAKIVFRGLDNHKEVNENHNTAVAVGRAAGAVATGLVIRGALGHDSALLDRILWAFIGQAMLIVVSLLYQKLTPYDDLAELKGKNLAAGLPIAGILLAVGITVEAVLHGEGAGWAADLQSMGVDMLAMVALLFAMRVATDRVMLGGARLKDEIVRDRNVGVGLIEATSFVTGAVILAFFLS
ncbi:MAG: DUF350 domain-containing protein [Myxococcota bacterium]